MSHLLMVGAMFSMLFVGCENSGLDEQMGGVLGERIECRINVVGRAMVDGMGATRAIESYEDSSEFKIENLWVVQLDQNGVVVGYPEYIEHYMGTETVSVINPGVETHELIYIANTYDSNLPVYLTMNKTDLETMSTSVFKVEHCFHTEIVDGVAEVRLPMSGIVKFKSTDIIGGSLPSADLESSVAKVVLNLKRDVDFTTSDFEFDYVEMKSVCNTLSVYNSDESIASGNYPLISEFGLIDYPVEEVTDGKNTFTYYVPTNCRGRRDNDDSTLKPHFAPPQATYANVVATLNGVPRSYRFYLGSNLTNDFNVKSGHCYTYNLTFNSEGDYTVDTRIEDFSTTDYTEYPSANCYILNPIIGASREYLIPVAERSNRFWTLYKSVPENLIYENTEWVCELIWTDTQDVEGLDGTKMTFERDATNHLAMRVKVPPGLSAGNYLVGIKKSAAETEYLWSWHLWVTDYNPNDLNRTLAHDPSLKEFRYGVTGGEVHRYSSDAAYYFMDRNIGSRSSDALDDFEGVLLYEYGRKDPFLPTLVKRYDANGVALEHVVEFPNTMDYAVNHPMIYLKRNEYSDVNTLDWEASKEEYKGFNFTWNDKNVIKGKDGVTKEIAKSIFDPSPLGWMIPYDIYAIPNALTTPVAAPETYKATRVLTNRGYKNCYYYMLNEMNCGNASTSNYLVKFPVSSYFNESGVFSTTVNNIIFLWNSCSHPYAVGYGYSTVSSTINDFYYVSRFRSQAIAVRPVYFPADLVKIKPSTNN